MSEIFKLKRSHLRTGLVAMPILVWGVIYSFWLSEPNIMLRVGIPCMLVVGLWLLISYWRVRLVLDGERVHFRHVFSRRTICLPDAVRARWKQVGNSNTWLTIELEGTKEVLSFRDFAWKDQLVLIRFFREGLPAELQDGWNDRVLARAEKKVVPVWTLLVVALLVGVTTGLQGGAVFGVSFRELTGSILLDCVLSVIIVLGLIMLIVPLGRWLLDDGQPLEWRYSLFR